MKPRRIIVEKRPSRAQLRELVCSAPIETVHMVRPQMISLGQKLLENPHYPNDGVVDRLAEIFARQLMAERN